MDIISYLKPDSPVAASVLAFLAVTFLAWALWLARWLKDLSRYRREISGCADLGTLTDFINAAAAARAKHAAAAAAQPVSQAQAEAAFRQFCGSKSLDEKSPVARHIGAIFDAGWRESRLDVSELIRHTGSEVFRPGGLLRSLAALFIIIGLLGTLFGLAASLAELSPFSRDNSAQSLDALTQSLRLLLRQLKNAFAPSIWGIILTILGVISLSLVVHYVAAPVKSLLERMTLTVWVPRLFASATLRQKFEAAERVARFAKNIEGEARRLEENLGRVNGPLELLSQISIRLGTHADKFSEGVNNLTAFQQDIKALYQQVVDSSENLHTYVRESVEREGKFQANVLAVLEDQGNKIKTLMHSLNVYEEAYVEQRGEIDTRLREVLVEARKAYSAAIDRNRELVKQIGDPLRADLSRGLGEVSKTLSEELEGVRKKFADFDAPISQAAGQISVAFGTVVERTESLNKEFHEEFTMQMASNREQLRLMTDAHDKLATLLTGLKDATDAQGRQSGNFNATVGELSKNVASLGDSLSGLSQSVNLNGSATQQPGADAADAPVTLFHLASLLVRISKTDETQNELLRALAAELRGLKEQVGAMREQPGRDRPAPATAEVQPGHRDDESEQITGEGEESSHKGFFSGWRR